MKGALFLVKLKLGRLNPLIYSGVFALSRLFDGEVGDGGKLHYLEGSTGSQNVWEIHGTDTVESLSQ